VASLLAMKSREIKDPKKRAKYAKKSVESFKKLEPKVRKTKKLRSLKDYYETKARTYFQLPWPYAKSPEKLKTFRTASFYITKYLQKHKWLPSEELGIFYLELALTEYDEGNELKAKVAAKKARKFKLSLVQDQLAKKLEKGSI
jgi:hypothetical protein